MAVCALASKQGRRAPVKWIETRTEHMTPSAHGNERTFRDTRVALDKNGVITAIVSRISTIAALIRATNRSAA